MHARPLAKQVRAYENTRDSERRLRVGYVSADFFTHPAAYFFEPLLAAHDRTNLEIFCYSAGARSDETTNRLREIAGAWRSIVGMNDETVARIIEADAIDILVDLSGHTAGNRLLVFARKPAPVQATYLGSLTTTGLTAIDYKLTDRFLTPDGTAERFSEELVRLPHCFVCYQPPHGAPPVAALPSSKGGRVTFGSFNNLTKVMPEVVALWSRILRALPETKIILKDRTLADPAQCARYLGLFAENGVEAGRVELLPRTTMADYLAVYDRVDIAFDPFPYNGCTTTCDALWMGVPVITLAGAMSYSRFGVSLLSNLGLDELIAATPDKYVEKAVALANDRKRLMVLRSELRSRMAASPLCDAKAFAKGIEEAYRRMWRRWCKSSGEM